MKPNKIISLSSPNLSRIEKQLHFLNRSIVFILSILLVFFFSSANIIRKNVVRFTAADGVLITADHYFVRKNLPYILLLHQELSSRGEFDSIAEKIVKTGYNCLAVDLRTGLKYGYIENETSRSVAEGNRSSQPLDALKDISAAAEYAWNMSGQKIILLGSGTSASLALIEAKTNEHVKAVIALSPGEYFRPELDMKSFLADFSKMAFVSCSHIEYPFIAEMFSAMSDKYKTVFKPTSGAGARGSMAFYDDNPAKDEYWLSLLLFLRSTR